MESQPGQGKLPTFDGWGDYGMWLAAFKNHIEGQGIGSMMNPTLTAAWARIRGEVREAGITLANVPADPGDPGGEPDEVVEGQAVRPTCEPSQSGRRPPKHGRSGRCSRRLRPRPWRS